MSCNINYIQSKPKYRLSVPKALKDRLWDLTFGKDAGQGNCDVCNITINSKRFEAGHIKSVYHGGLTNIDNLKCICSTCNKSMGKQNLEEFKNTYFPAICNKIKKQNKCECCCHNDLKSTIVTSHIIFDKEIKNEFVKCVEIDLDDYDDNCKKKLNIKLNELNKFVYVPSNKTTSNF
jgi:hypothetical protein